ncbi:MAG: protein-tyrosine-phosphatase [Candidatus Pacebacteria bacterium CG10_big_fil_rev_8_21_14_0_10_42_12]|nr:MAG: protein-tyrosine-phosphatase [Candidatus Pacebacteria bacterium CG10_big_fil_rev_8_21_14_0_10_42_12]
MSKKLNLLAVCSKNKIRSLTLEKIYANDQRIDVRSVGTSPKARRKISSSDIAWADLILCMEDKHKEIIAKQFGRNDLPEIQVLDIPDRFVFMEPELITLIEDGVEEVIKNSTIGINEKT